MSVDERLKRRIGTNIISQKDFNSSGYSNNNDIKAGHRADTSSHHISTPTTKTRRRKKRVKKDCASKYRTSVVSLLRAARAFDLQNQHSTCNDVVVSSPHRILAFLLCLVIAFFIFFENNGGGIIKTDNLRKQASKVQRKMMMSNFEISFPKKLSDSTFAKLSMLQMDAIDIGLYQDYGGLEIQNTGRKRQIIDFDYLWETDFRDPDKHRDDDGNDAYFAFDDDFLKGTDGTLNKNPSGKICRRTSAHRLNLQNCNTIHETSFLENNVKYLNAGSYRQVFGLTHSFLQQQESVAVKDMYAGSVGEGDYEFARMDAMVAERLTRSPRIYDIYGFCGVSILSEFFPYGDIEDTTITGSGYLLTEEEQKSQELNDLKSYNDIRIEEKLRISLQMAEALADLHGDPSGAIVHQDVQLSQYLLSSDNRTVKLNDFNRAEFMLWDEEEKEYCKYGEGYGQGNWRSPEEYFDNDLNEQVDVYSLANNMYSLLTGLWVFYDEDSDDKVQKRLRKGEKPHIDPRYKERSLGEAKLAEIIDQCHSFKPENRPSIFQVVKFLRDALEEVKIK